jgi:hypothetical protein
MHKSKEVSGNRKKASDDRKRIAEVLLAERLVLNEDGMDLESIADLPETLPANGGRKMSLPEAKEVEKQLALLVECGCRRSVLYWCLAQLGPEADERRKGKERYLVPAEDEAQSHWVTKTPALPTREDMTVFINASRAYERALRQVEKGLLLVADARGDTHPLPQGMLTDGPDDAHEAMLIHRQSVAWARKLAEDYQAPNVGLLVKSKGVLFLLAYVWLHTKQSPASSRNMRGKGPRQTKPYRIGRQQAQTIAEIADLYCALTFRAEDLIDKLENFQAKDPNNFAHMVGLLKSLDDVWRIQEGQREWMRFIPNLPPPDRGSMISCLEVSDAEIRSSIDRTAALVRKDSLKTPASAHKHFVGLIREGIIAKRKASADARAKPSGTSRPADPPPAESAPEEALPPETKKHVRSDKAETEQPNSPAKLRKR